MTAGGIAPSITTQPASQTVPQGSDVTFSVQAAGTPPLSYQWRFNGVDIAGATSSSITLPNVQPSQGGKYVAVVSNGYGTTTSASAGLTVTAPPTCVGAPSGLVAWYRAEGTASDSAGANPGTLMGSATFGAGKVGQGFSLSGSPSFVRIPDSPSLRLTSALTIECWYKDTGSTWFYGLIAKRLPTQPETTAFGINVQAGSKIQVYYRDPTLAQYQISEYSPVPATNVFHHLAATFQQTDSTHVDVITYIDGQAVKTVTLGGSLANCQTNTPVTLGASYETGECLVGVLDEASIYNRALSAAELQAIYNAGAAGKCSTDSDHDGLPDEWEIQHFGSITTYDGGADPDGDGYSNLEEYQNGTPPTVLNLRLSISEPKAGALIP